MSKEVEMVFSHGVSVQPPGKVRKRSNLGTAILLAAVLDYRSLHEEVHRDAARFLYPQTPEARDHYAWVVSLAEGLNPAWLRSSLDRSRAKWDWLRRARVVNTGRRKRATSDEARKCS